MENELQRLARLEIDLEELRCRPMSELLGTVVSLAKCVVDLARTCKTCRRRCCCPGKHKSATHVAFVLQGEAMTDIIATVGDAPKKFHANLLKDDETVDTSFENAEYGYDSPGSGVTTAPDGSSSFVADGLDVTISFGAASAKDADGNPIPSTIAFDADSDQSSGQQIIGSTITVTVLAPEVNATHVTFSEVAP